MRAWCSEGGVPYLATTWLALWIKIATEELLVHRAGVVSLAYAEVLSAIALP